MCIELTLKDGCKKVHVVEDKICAFMPAKDHEKGSEVMLVGGGCLCVEECPTEIHKLLYIKMECVREL